MPTEPTTHRPTHRVYAVLKRNSDERGNWREIGAAWRHRDDKGFALKLNLIPLLHEADIVIRAIEPWADAKIEPKQGANKRTPN